MMPKCAIAFSIAFFISCTSEDRYIPDEVIAVNKMKLLVWDMMQAGALAEVQYVKDSNLTHKKTIEKFQQLLRIHKTGKEHFYKSFQYYKEHPILNRILFDSVSAYATRQRQELYKKKSESLNYRNPSKRYSDSVNEQTDDLIIE